MATTKISTSYDANAAIRYVLEEDSHKDGMDRVLAASGHNCNPYQASYKFRETRKAFNKNDGKHAQAYRLIQSFGKDELSADNEEDIERANKIGKELAEKLYPKHEAIVVTQADGEGGMLHNHIVVNAVGFIDGKSLRGNENRWVHISQVQDEIIKEHGLKPIENENKSERRGNTMAHKKMREAKAKDPNVYIWTDELHDKVVEGFNDLSYESTEEFAEHMQNVHGVGVQYQYKRNGDIKGVTYDIDNALTGEKMVSSASKLGKNLSYAAIDENIERNKAHRAELDAQPPVKKAKEPEKEPVKVESSTDDIFGFDLDAELQKYNAPRPKKVKNHEETQIMRDVREEREKLEAEKEEARIEKERADAAAAQKAIDDKIKADQEAENQRIAREKAKRDAEDKENAKAEAERIAREAAEIEKQRKEIEDAKYKAAEERIRKENRMFPNQPLIKPNAPFTKREFIDRYLSIEHKVKHEGLQMKTVAGKQPMQPHDIKFSASSQLNREKSAEQQTHQEHTPSYTPEM